METTTINVGSLVKTTMGVFGIVSKFNHKDKLYTISWANGMRQGENVIYDKKMIDYFLIEGDWKHFSPGTKEC
tara:strand:+ start:206 stop:424 length:219 start_codon:yes stop_codon:yes gene_type:complete